VTRKPLLSFLEEHGHTPLPPYIARDWKDAPDDLRREDRLRYQTVYARRPGAVAAPTAGLHFTHELFERLEKKGIHRVFVTLHVGIGTFRPVTVDDVDTHRMDEERYEISTEAAKAIANTREMGGKVVAIGSTSVRTLETVAAQEGEIKAASGRTDLFIRPPYTFRAVDAIITNFHLPKSTLLMMMSAFAGRERMLAAYEEAVREEYRFYSYGDCMLIL
jgi:S-adenosylmethionine:tRNA ribosyltransferase-isomerase